MLVVSLLVLSLIFTSEKIVDIYKGNLKYLPISASFVNQETQQETQFNLILINQFKASGKKVVILDPVLSLYYPYLKLSNPLRYDFPTKGNFGVNNGSDIINYVENNSNVCVFVSKFTIEEEFFPSEIVKSIQAISTPKTSIGRWDIYCR